MDRGDVKASLVLRPAEPTREEGLVYGRYLDDLAPGFRYVLGREAVGVIASAFVEPGHDLSFEHTTFAERDGSIVGVIAGYTGEQHRRSVDGALKRAMDGSGVGSMRIAALAKWLRHFGPKTDGELYVWVLEVNEGMRGEGIGTVMMDFAEERARGLGATRLCLDADAKNEGGRRFYERRGMTVESEWPTLPLVPAMVVRMSKPLPPALGRHDRGGGSRVDRGVNGTSAADSRSTGRMNSLFPQRDFRAQEGYRQNTVC